MTDFLSLDFHHQDHSLEYKPHQIPNYENKTGFIYTLLTASSRKNKGCIFQYYISKILKEQLAYFPLPLEKADYLVNTFPLCSSHSSSQCSSKELRDILNMMTATLTTRNWGLGNKLQLCIWQACFSLNCYFTHNDFR